MKGLINFLKKYGDIVVGFFGGITIIFASKFDIDIIQLAYSMMILILTSIGISKVVKFSIDKNIEKSKGRKIRKRKDTIIDSMVDNQKSNKAVNFAQNPTQEGEKVGKALLETMKGGRIMVKKMKKFFDKFKGYMLTAVLLILTFIEENFSVVNDIFGDKLIINGHNVITYILAVCAVIVALLSDRLTSDERIKFKSITSKSTSNEIVIEAKKQKLKAQQLQLKNDTKLLDIKNNELEILEKDLSVAKEKYNGQVALYEDETINIVLATADDVEQARNVVDRINEDIRVKTQEIIELETKINENTTIINKLKASLE